MKKILFLAVYICVYSTCADAQQKQPQQGLLPMAEGMETYNLVPFVYDTSKTGEATLYSIFLPATGTTKSKEGYNFLIWNPGLTDSMFNQLMVDLKQGIWVNGGSFSAHGELITAPMWKMLKKQYESSSNKKLPRLFRKKHFYILTAYKIEVKKPTVFPLQTGTGLKVKEEYRKK